MKPRLHEAEEGKRRVYFVDAAHFVHGAFIGYLWCFCRLFMPTPSGRNRYNILGALDAISHGLVTIKNESYINAQSVCGLLIKLKEMNPPKMAITVILDNARYQRCQLVMGFAGELGIELLFLPSYSPNLNLIERVWKWVKKDCLYSKYYEKFISFKWAIDNSLKSAMFGKGKKKLDSLLSLNFQLFKIENYPLA